MPESTTVRLADLQVGAEAPPVVLENISPHPLRALRGRVRATSTRCTTTTPSRPQVGNPSVFGHGMLTAGLMARVAQGLVRSRGAPQLPGAVLQAGLAGRDAHVHRDRHRRVDDSGDEAVVELELDGREPGRRGQAHRDRHAPRSPKGLSRWGSSTDASRSSPDRGAASGASSRCAWRARARSVVVNDVGVSLDGQGTDDDPAAQVCKEIEALGGEAVPNYDSVSDFDGAERIVQTAVDAFGTARHPREQRRHRARPVAAEDERGRLRRGRRGAHEGHVQLRPSRRADHEGSRLRPHHQHHVVGRSARQLRPDQLRRGQGRRSWA